MQYSVTQPAMSDEVVDALYQAYLDAEETERTIHLALWDDTPQTRAAYKAVKAATRKAKARYEAARDQRNREKASSIPARYCEPVKPFSIFK